MALGLTTAAVRPAFFWLIYGPGDRNHSADFGRNLFISFYLINLVHTVVYNLLARSRVRVHAQRVLLGRLQLSEVIVVSIVALVYVFVRVTGEGAMWTASNVLCARHVMVKDKSGLSLTPTMQSARAVLAGDPSYASKKRLT